MEHCKERTDVSAAAQRAGRGLTDSTEQLVLDVEGAGLGAGVFDDGENLAASECVLGLWRVRGLAYLESFRNDLERVSHSPNNWHRKTHLGTAVVPSKDHNVVDSHRDSVMCERLTRASFSCPSPLARSQSRDLHQTPGMIASLTTTNLYRT